MKRSNFVIGAIIMGAMLFSTTSCKKEGCMDATSLTYDADAKKDDGSCTYPSDKLTGSWTVAETVSGNTVTYSATIARKNDDEITISSTRSTPPVYYMNNLDVTVKWTVLELEKTGSTVTGTISSENDFEIDYLYGAGSSVYSVNQHYTR